MPDGTDVPLRTGRCLYVHGVLSSRGNRSSKPWRIWSVCAFLWSLHGWRYGVWRGWPASVVLHSFFFSSDQLRFRVCSFLSSLVSTTSRSYHENNVSTIVAVHPQIGAQRRNTSSSHGPEAHAGQGSHSQSVATFARKNLLICKRTTHMPNEFLTHTLELLVKTYLTTRGLTGILYLGYL